MRLIDADAFIEYLKSEHTLIYCEDAVSIFANENEIKPLIVSSGDTISRQAAIDALWKALHDYEDKTEKQFQESDDLDVSDWIEHRIFVQNMNDIDRKVIAQLSPAQQRTERWISCKKRLPEVGVPVLTFDGKYMRVERHIDWIDADGEKLKGEWWIDGTEGDNYNCVGLRDGTATHWMPLPEPYKESENE